MDLYPERFNIVCTVSSSREVRQVELDLIPSFIQPHRHCADEGFHSCSALIIRCSKSSPNVLVVQYLHFESKVLFQLSWRLFVIKLTFLMIMTRKGNLMPRVLLASAGHVMKLVETLVPMISRTDD